MSFTVALSPSTQTWNVGNYIGTNEQEINYAIAGRAAELLRNHGVPTIVLDAGRDDPRNGYIANAHQSNQTGPWTVHVCLHTDAGGATGSTAFYYPGSVASQRLATAIYNRIAPFSPGADHGVRARGDLYELNETVAIATLIETAPHDRPADAAWLQSHIPEIAQAYAAGILDYAGINHQIGEEMPTAQEIAEAILNAQVMREGLPEGHPLAGHPTSLRNIIAWSDANIDATRAAVTQPAAADADAVVTELARRLAR